MSEVEQLLPAYVLRNMCDKMYEKRKAAALEVEQVVKNLAQGGMWDKIKVLLKKLVDDYTLSANANHRKGGLLCLAAATVGLKSFIGNSKFDYIEQIVGPVSASLLDQDPRVRYYACEALFNIAKSAQACFISDQQLFTSVFTALFKIYGDTDCNVQNAAQYLNDVMKNIAYTNSNFSIGEFVIILEKFIFATNAYKRQFLLGWLTTLYNIPSLDILPYLYSLLPGLMLMLNDEHKEIQQAVSKTLQDFLMDLSDTYEAGDIDMSALIIILLDLCSIHGDSPSISLALLNWLDTIAAISFKDILDHYSRMVSVSLCFIGNVNTEVQRAAQELSSKLLKLDDKESWSIIYKQDLIDIIIGQLNDGQELQRLEALRWLEYLLVQSPSLVLEKNSMVISAVINTLTMPLEIILEASIKVICLLSKQENQLTSVLEALLHRFEGKEGLRLLHRSGVYIIQKLCSGLGAVNIYTEMSRILQGDRFDNYFCETIVQALNILLVTSPDLDKISHLLRNGPESGESVELFLVLYPAWCKSTCAALTLCLLHQSYSLAWDIIKAFGNSLSGSSSDSMVQLIRLVKLLEAPAFAFLRLQLIQEERDPYLLRCMHGLLMLLPQTEAFRMLLSRIKMIPNNISPLSGNLGMSDDSQPEFENYKTENTNHTQLLCTFKKIQLQKHSSSSKSLSELNGEK